MVLQDGLRGLSEVQLLFVQLLLGIRCTKGAKAGSQTGSSGGGLGMNCGFNTRISATTAGENAVSCLSPSAEME